MGSEEDRAHHMLLDQSQRFLKSPAEIRQEIEIHFGQGERSLKAAEEGRQISESRRLALMKAVGT